MQRRSFQQFRRSRQSALAALGVGALITMGTQSLAHQASSAGAGADTWKANTTSTMTTQPVPISFAPTIKSAYCGDHSPHAWADGCPW
ncbi:hypothetical protein [Mycolicibacterium mucogenicum]|uniref:hypothetical protein n=1 Tax=Mycolicibacterium mucogenicum TaxID=56689 RepID=UPI000B087E42|nr:hypothetical protein [Mycolicibacterium mucogenicum]